MLLVGCIVPNTATVYEPDFAYSFPTILAFVFGLSTLLVIGIVFIMMEYQPVCVLCVRSVDNIRKVLIMRNLLKEDGETVRYIVDTIAPRQIKYGLEYVCRPCWLRAQRAAALRSRNPVRMSHAHVRLTSILEEVTS